MVEDGKERLELPWERFMKMASVKVLEMIILSRVCLKLNNGQKFQFNRIQIMALSMKCQSNTVP